MKKPIFYLTLILVVLFGVQCNLFNKEKKNSDSVVDSLKNEKDTLNQDSLKMINDQLLLQKKRTEDSINVVRLAEERLYAVRNSIKVTSCYLSSQNSADGCDAIFYYINLSGKTIKYLVWKGEIYDAAGDPLKCEIRPGYIFEGKDIGPIRSGRSAGKRWENIIYNSQAKRLKITSIVIKYMDESSLSITKPKELRMIGLK
jgi:hypothetical protein